MKITLLIEHIYMYTATQASVLHRWKLNLNTCKKCMLRYWKIPLSVCKSHIAQFGKSFLSFLATNFSSTEYSKSSGSSMSDVRSTRTYVKKLECDHYNTHVHTHIRFHVIMITTSSMSENTIKRMPRERPDFGWNWSFSQNSMGRRCWSLYK